MPWNLRDPLTLNDLQFLFETIHFRREGLGEDVVAISFFFRNPEFFFELSQFPFMRFPTNGYGNSFGLD